MMPKGVNGYGFEAVPLGDPISEWFPIDVDGDGTQELALLTAGTPARVGVFEPETEVWIDGPHELGVQARRWTVCDPNGNGVPDYIYTVGRTLYSRDFSVATPDSLGAVDFDPRGIIHWGFDTAGTPLVGISEDRWGFGSSGSLKRSYWLHVFTLPSLDSSYVLATGPSVLRTEMSCVVADEHRLVHKFWVTVGYPEWSFVPRQSFTTIAVSGELDRTLSVGLKLNSPEGGCQGCWDTWYLAGAAVICPTDDTAPRVGWLVAIKHFSDTAGPLWSIAGCYADTGTRSLWEFSDPGVINYRDIIAYDILGSPGPEFILPRASDSSWEIRNSVDGTVLEIRPDQPAVDLSTGSLYNSDSSELYYIADSILYVYQPDVNTGVFDDPEVPHVPTAFVTISAHPNPFNSAVTLTWSGAASSLAVYNVLGQIVTEIPVEGRTSANWDGCDSQSHECPSGIYIAQVASRNFTTSTKIVLLR
jgi:hypothetical protein